MEIIMKIGATVTVLSLFGCIAAMALCERRVVPLHIREYAEQAATYLGMSFFGGLIVSIVAWIWT